MFRKNDSLFVEIYTDVNYARSVVDRRSTIDYCTFQWGTLLTWRSKKLNIVAESSVESEFLAMAQGVL